MNFGSLAQNKAPFSLDPLTKFAFFAPKCMSTVRVFSLGTDHFEEEVQVSVLGPWTCGKGGQRRQYNAKRPQFGHGCCTRGHSRELASMELVPNQSAPSEPPSPVRISIWAIVVMDRMVTMLHQRERRRVFHWKKERKRMRDERWERDWVRKRGRMAPSEPPSPVRVPAWAAIVMDRMVTMLLRRERRRVFHREREREHGWEMRDERETG